MGTQDFEDPSTVWFITEVDTDKVAAIKTDPRVNVSYASDKGLQRSRPEFWESPGTIATAVRLVKGIVTDDKPDLANQGVVEL